MANLSDIKIGDRVRFDMYENGDIYEGAVDRIVPTSDGKDSSDPDHTPDTVRICLEPGLYKWTRVKNVELVRRNGNGNA
jgi:hypothetical protein